jgi:hypothetical protein
LKNDAFAQLDDIINIDVGGTSADVSLVLGGQLALTTSGTTGDFSLQLPIIDIHTSDVFQPLSSEPRRIVFQDQINSAVLPARASTAID